MVNAEALTNHQLIRELRAGKTTEKLNHANQIQQTLAALAGLGALCLLGCAAMPESKMTISLRAVWESPGWHAG